MKLKERIVRSMGYTVNQGIELPKEDITIKKETSILNKSENDFRFESNLGLFLSSGFDAFEAEGNRQGYDDPSKANYDKQVKLLKVQLGNNLQREVFIKENKLSMLQTALDAADEIVGAQIEFVMQLKRSENELKYLQEQIALVDEGLGWYLMLNEALHDGFQVGAKKKLFEINEKYDL